MEISYLGRRLSLANRPRSAYAGQVTSRTTTGSFISASGAPVVRTLGIDLGTSNTCAAYADGRVPRMIPTERNSNLLASVVAFDGDKVLLGQPAKEQLVMRPESTVYGSKRLLGRAFHSAQAQRLRQHFAYPIVEGERGRCGVEIEGEKKSLTSISALLLEQIARYALRELNEDGLEGVVITVPAHYPLSQRLAVKQAAEAAGLDVWRLLNEPTAAALAYGIGREDQRLMVFDLGGGTFDVSILEVNDGTFHVLATGGDGFLGGVDFDIALGEHLMREFAEETGIRLQDDRTVAQRVLGAAEATKIDLSVMMHTEVRLPFVAHKRGKPVDLVRPVSRPEFEMLTRGLVDRCFAVAERVMRDAGMKLGDIDEVLLAGGQTRMPLIQAEITRRFGKAPRKGVHPDEVVAQGAALLARSLAGSRRLQLLDVLSVPLGVARRQDDGSMKVVELVAGNATLPHEAEMVIDTWVDDQQVMEIDLYQGHSSDPASSEYLGSVLYDALPLGPAGTRSVFLSVHLDTEGLLAIRAHHGNEHAARELPLVARAPAYLDEADDEVADEWEAPPNTMSGILQRLLKR